MSYAEALIPAQPAPPETMKRFSKARIAGYFFLALWALLGIALITDLRSANFGVAVLLAIGAAVALALLLLAFAALYERLQHADVPMIFREAPLALITAGIMALAFMGFSGLIQE